MKAEYDSEADALSIDLLGEAAVRSGVEPELLEAAAQSALAAPDRTISLTFSPALG